ncbi:NmrA family transcriptional regulator [Pedobacter sp. HMWF019]|uniref:NmrA family NAD(P)-binding protein n=1 Tax=Pedobacter sp. HMWF019 TaxID=2056856 RepID=UPI000D364C1B|nr:NmrA family NAD(P)-binding protein [Pedobacter sp. HMWF019]PTT02185.1 NmrA family transcriptional regulator [Pedobacter sp. HMWF019]
MHIILGGTGHIGSALAEALIAKGEKVTIISRNQSKREEWEQKGAEFAVVDIFDEQALRQTFNLGERLFLLNPPAAPSTDTVAQEKKSLAAILKALKGSKIKKVVAESTYGAQSGDDIGDLGVLYSMEQALAEMEVPVSIIRGAYYMSNWAASLDMVKKTGQLHTLYPADFELPMVAPKDIGQFAARLMLEAVAQTGLHHVEGPKEYSPGDVADAFAELLNKPVEVVQTPKSQWFASLQEIGFSEKAAQSMVAMTQITLDQHKKIEDPIRGQTTLKEFISELVR